MKNKCYTSIILTVLTLLCFATSGFAAAPKNFSNEIKLNGMVLRSNHSKHGVYKIELLSNKTLINSGMISSNRRFEFKLYKNIFYTIRISKKGLISLLLSVDTRFFSKNPKHCDSYYDTELLKDTLISSFDKQISDPSAEALTYDNSKERFYPDATYKATIEKQIVASETQFEERLYKEPKHVTQIYDLKTSVK